MAKKRILKVTSEIEEFIESYTRAIQSDTAAVFAGAGLSAPAGFVNWKSLLRGVARELDLNVDKEDDLVALAQYHFNKRGRHKINQLLIDQFSQRAVTTKSHKLLAKLPIKTYWTTNYDHLIEDSLNEAGKTPDIKMTTANLSVSAPKSDAIVYKMHGDCSHPDEAILTKEDYESFEPKRSLFSTALQGDLVSKTFLFIGFSFSDPNIGYILGRIRILLGQNQRSHYCLMKKVLRSDFSSNNKYVYAKTKQDLQISDLRRYSINAVLVDDYADIPELLDIISRRIGLTRVLISGSAEVYAPWEAEKSISFIHKLSYELAKNNYKIVSGFGPGVGSAVINGVLEYVFSTSYQHIDEYLVLRPFPQIQSGEKPIKELWTDYRKEMVGQAGVALFVFGNKEGLDGNPINADGVRIEFEMAVERGLKVIPIGSTGWMSENLWKKVNDNFKDYLGTSAKIKKQFKVLGNKKATPNQLVKAVQEILNLLQEK